MADEIENRLLPRYPEVSSFNEEQEKDTVETVPVQADRKILLPRYSEVPSFTEDDAVDEGEIEPREDEPFWHPWVRQATATYLTKHKPAAEIIQRTGLRTADDLYNAINEYIPLGEEAQWEDEWLGDPKSAVVDITTDIASWTASFFGPGTVLTKTATLPAKLPKIKKGLTAIKETLEGTNLGQKLSKVFQIGAQGFARGVVADYIRTDVDDLDKREAVEKRIKEVYIGGAIGTGVNFGLAGLGFTVKGVSRIVNNQMKKIDAVREVRKASEGKADPEQALRDLKDAVEEENAIKADLREQINPTKNDFDVKLKPKVDEPELEDFDLEFKPKVEEGGAKPPKEQWQTTTEVKGEAKVEVKTSSWKGVDENGEPVEVVVKWYDGKYQGTTTYELNPDGSRGQSSESLVNKVTEDKLKQGDEEALPEVIGQNRFFKDTETLETSQKRLEEAKAKLKKKTEPVEEVEAPVVEEPKPKLNPEDEVLAVIQGKENWPQQVQALTKETAQLSNRLTPKISAAINEINQLDAVLKQESKTNIGKGFEKVKKQVLTLEDEFLRYRKLVDIRARAAHFSGQALNAFRRNKKIDLTGVFKYNPQVRAELDNIDRILDLIGSVKAGKNPGENIVRNIRTELNLIEDVIETGNLSKALDKQFNLTAESSVNTIWGRYKKRISDQVLKELRTKQPTNKASLELFSNRVSATIKGAVKGEKKIAAKVKTALSDVQDVIKNPAKYREAIDQIITDITKAEKIPAADVKRSLRILEDLKEGVNSKRFIDSLPNRDKIVQKILREEIDNIGKQIREAVKTGSERELVTRVMGDLSRKIKELSPSEKSVLLNTIRVELSNTIASVRDSVLGNFKSKELYKQYTLKNQIRELDEMSDKSIAEIKEYLKVNARKVEVDPDGIKQLKEEAKSSRKVLTDRLKNEEIAAKNAFNESFLRELVANGRYGVYGKSNYELGIRAAETFRINTGLLMGFRTVTIGVLSGLLQSITQPLELALKTYFKTKNLQKLGEISNEIKAHQLALAELRATSVYLTSFADAFSVLKQSLKTLGAEEGAFMPQALKSHDELVGGVSTSLKNNRPFQINFKDKKSLERLVKKYGIERPETDSLLRRVLEDAVLEEATTGFGKSLFPMLTASFRAMGVADQPILYISAMRNLRAQYLKEGIEKNLTGEALEKFVKENIDESIVKEGNVFKWADIEKNNDVRELALATVFRQEYADKYISKMGEGVARWTRTGGAGGDDLLSKFNDPYINPTKVAARWLVATFIKTPTIIAQWTVDKFPVARFGHLLYMGTGKIGLGTPTQRAIKDVQSRIDEVTKALNAKTITKDLKEDFIKQREDLVATKRDLVLKQAEIKAEALGDFFLGTALVIGITHVAAAGRITGSGAHLTPEQKKRLLKNNADWKPNHIYIGDRSFDYSRLEPISTILSAYVDVFHHYQFSNDTPTEDDASLANTLLLSFIHNFKNKTFLRGFSDILDVLDPNTSEGKVESYIASQISTVFPRPIRELNTLNDEFQEYALGLREKLRQRVGVTNQRYERNIFGEKVERKYQNPGLFGLVNPIYTSTLKNDAVINAIADFREPVGKQDFYRKAGLRGDIDIRKFRNSSTDYPLFQAYSDLMSTKRKDTTIFGEYYEGLTLRRAVSRLMRTKEYKQAANYGQSVDGEYTKIGLLGSLISEYRNHFWNQMKEDRRYNNYVDEDGVSWKKFVRIEGVEEKRRKRTERTKGMKELMLPTLD